MKPIHTTFKSDNIIFDEINDYKLVKASKDIKKGEILLIEHCYTAKNGHISLQNLVRNTPILFDSLCPRNIKWNQSMLSDTSENIKSIVKEKLMKNCIINNEDIIVGIDISSFNHSTNPNSIIKSCNLNSFAYKPIKNNLVYVVAYEDIKMGDEILTWYGDGYFGENNNISFNVEEYKNYINDIALKYTKTDVFLNTTILHTCINHGLYITDKNINMTPAFISFFEKEYGKYPTRENIDKWLKSMATSIIY
jgi:hypothetical protein